MKFTRAAISIISWRATRQNLCGVRADGELISSWIQYTGADMLVEECAELVHNPDSLKYTKSKASKNEPRCFFSAEVRAIYNDTALANPGCPSGVLEIDGESTPMSIRVGSIEHFENFVRKSSVCRALLLLPPQIITHSDLI